MHRIRSAAGLVEGLQLHPHSLKPVATSGWQISMIRSTDSSELTWRTIRRAVFASCTCSRKPFRRHHLTGLIAEVADATPRGRSAHSIHLTHPTGPPASRVPPDGDRNS